MTFLPERLAFVSGGNLLLEGWRCYEYTSREMRVQTGIRCRQWTTTHMTLLMSTAGD